jgi:hypothetical protein
LAHSQAPHRPAHTAGCRPALSGCPCAPGTTGTTRSRLTLHRLHQDHWGHHGRHYQHLLAMLSCVHRLHFADPRRCSWQLHAPRRGRRSSRTVSPSQGSSGRGR